MAKPNVKDKYIKLSQALEVLDSCACWWAHEQMERIPSADVRPVVRGKWEEGCSVCGSWNLFDFDGYNCESNFCPNCGADMRMDGGT